MDNKIYFLIQFTKPFTYHFSLMRLAASRKVRTLKDFSLVWNIEDSNPLLAIVL